MPQQGGLNIEDPAKMDAIRRGSHEYVPTEGKHGVYRAKSYVHNEYPKVMDKTPAPRLVDFKGQGDAQAALNEAMRVWEMAQTASIVKNEKEEKKWLEEEKKEKSRAA